VQTGFLMQRNFEGH